MSQELYKQEQDLLVELTQWEAEASKSRLALEYAEDKVKSISTDLSDVREKLLKEFLDERLLPKDLGYTIKKDSGHIVLSVIPLIGGELEFDKFVSKLGWGDTDNIPLFYVLNYLDEGIPWGSQTTTTYV